MGACGSTQAHAPEACGRKPGTARPAAWMISSVMDMGMMSGKSKRTACVSEGAEVAKADLGCVCRKGQKLSATYPNQDSWSVQQLCNEVLVYGVFDGHGIKGHCVSDRVRQLIHKQVTTEAARLATPAAPEVLGKAFARCQASLDGDSLAKCSGTTATVAVHDPARNKLTMAHVGDSTAVLGRRKGHKLEAVTLTRDHKPTLEEERQRIIRSGGIVKSDGYSDRVFKAGTRVPGLNMSRSLGDVFGHSCGLSATPEISEVNLGPEEELLLLCSDGIWEVMDAQEAVDLVAKFGRDKAMQAAEALAAEARGRWLGGTSGTTCDDITVVLAYLQTPTAGGKALEKKQPSIEWDHSMSTQAPLEACAPSRSTSFASSEALSPGPAWSVGSPLSA